MRIILSLLLSLLLFDAADAKRVRGVHRQRVTSETEVAVQGLTWASNGEANSDALLKFTGSARPNTVEVTYIRRVYYIQQTGFYATMWVTESDGGFDADGRYYGTHPYPGPSGSSGTTHKFEIGAEGLDWYEAPYINGVANDVTKSQWYTQATRVRMVSSDRVVDFFWDLPDTTKKITRTTVSSELVTLSDGMLCYGNSPWSTSGGGVNVESHSGHLRGLQHYNIALSGADIITESNNHTINTPRTAAGLANVHYMNQSPTPSDVTDKSGLGHNPSWLNAYRPTLYSP
jgi:hypothetical protein